MENIINSLLIKCLRDPNYSLYITLIDDNYEYTKHKYVLGSIIAYFLLKP